MTKYSMNLREKIQALNDAITKETGKSYIASIDRVIEMAYEEGEEDGMERVIDDPMAYIDPSDMRED